MRKIFFFIVALFFINFALAQLVDVYNDCNIYGNCVEEVIIPGGGGQSGNFTSYVLVEEKTVTSAVTTLDFDTVLDGDVDGGYRIEVLMNNTSGSVASYTLRLNGATVTGNEQELKAVDTAITGAFNQNMLFSFSVNGFETTSILEIPFSKASPMRIMFFESQIGVTEVQYFTGIQEILTPNSTITSIGINSNVADSIGVGSQIKLYRKETVSIGADGPQGPPGVNGTGGGNGSWNTTSLGVLTDANSTQFFNSTGGVLNLLESWVDSLWCRLTGCTIDGDLNVTGDIEGGTFTLNSTTINDWDEIVSNVSINFGANESNTSGPFIPFLLTSEGVLKIDATEGIATDFVNINGLIKMIANWNFGNFQIKNVTDPTDDQDAATKAYVDFNDARLTLVTFNSNTTLTVNSARTILVNASGSSLLEIILPNASLSQNVTFYIQKINSNDSQIVIISTNSSSQTINTEDNFTLYIQGDTIHLTSDGSNWFIMSEQITPHYARLTRTTAQSIPNSAQTNISFTVILDDIGGIATVPSGGPVTIKRDGIYVITGYSSITGSQPAGTSTQANIVVNGAIKLANQIPFDGTRARPAVGGITLLLSAGDVVGSGQNQNTGGAKNTEFSAAFPHINPQLTIMEIR